MFSVIIDLRTKYQVDWKYKMQITNFNYIHDNSKSKVQNQDIDKKKSIVSEFKFMIQSNELAYE